MGVWRGRGETDTARDVLTLWLFLIVASENTVGKEELHTHTHTHTHIPTCTCTCTCTHLLFLIVAPRIELARRSYTHTHTHTYMYMYTYTPALPDCGPREYSWPGGVCWPLNTRALCSHGRASIRDSARTSRGALPCHSLPAPARWARGQQRRTSARGKCGAEGRLIAEPLPASTCACVVGAGLQ